MNAFTVDVEEWFHVCGVDGPLSPERWDALPSRVGETTRRLLDLLDRAGVRATFFVLGWVAERHPWLVREIHDRGHSIGSHGYAHRRTYELTPEAFADDLRASVAAIAAASGVRTTAFRAPEWSLDDRASWGLEIVAREGFTLDASRAPVRLVGRPDYPRHPHVITTAAGPLVETPPYVVDRLGQAMPLGWGWGLRSTSPRRVIRAVERANREGLPAVFMVHPWELDPDPPRVRLPWRLWLAHDFRLAGFADRLSTVLRNLPFATLDEVARSARSC